MAYSGQKALDALKIERYYPSKLSYHEATAIRRYSNAGEDQCCGVTLINRLLKSDFTSLEEITSQINKISNSKEVADQSNQGTSIKRPFHLKSRTISKENLLNPMDVIVVLLNCCDDILRQVLVEKLVSAKIGVPILLPSVHEKDFEPPVLLNWTLARLVSELPESVMKQKPLLSIPNPIISFLRVGNLHRSKSKLLSHLLNKTNPSVFYNRGCSNASAKRGPSNGCMEVAWFQSSKDADVDYQFNSNFFTILNLRGDAIDYTRHAKLLCESSSLVVIMSDSVDSLHRLSEKVLNDVCWNGARVAIAFVSENSGSFLEEFEKFSEASPLFKQVTDIQVTMDSNEGRRMSFSEWRSDIKEIIEQFLGESQQKTYFTLEVLSERAKSIGFALENDKKRFHFMEYAAKVFADFLYEHRLSQSSIIPLQGKSFKELAELERRKLRDIPKATKSIDDFISQMNEGLKNHRKQQCELVLKQAEPIKKFYKDLCSLRGNDFVNGLTFVFLSLKEKLPNENELIGFSDILRELGQQYETVYSTYCLENIGTELPSAIFQSLDFAQKVAELLLLGQPLELLNGDAFYVPMEWLKSVFKELASLTKNKKVFVLSAIGVQSSGKSTLLNALFGLHFPTSAGRCTKGLNCNLLPIDKTAISSDCDYLMVLDVEGFRAPEYTDSCIVRDNEMATFIVGLSDLTIVNIEGENWSEMNDVLQIVVYALLRIKQTKHNIKFMPSCVFVHQKISAQNFSEKTLDGQQVMMKFLDEMVEAAAKREGYSNITAFSDVIRYDAKDDSYSLPSIWLGCPPFATFCPEYCRAAANIRSALLRRIESRNICLNIDDLFKRISDVWNAILKENFVFNFRCTREALAYQSLSSAYCKIEWDLRNSNQRVVTVMVNKMLSIGSLEELDNEEKLKSEVEQKVGQNSHEADASLQKALSSMQYEDIAAKFRDSFVKQLGCLKKYEDSKAKDTLAKTLKIQRKKLENCKDIESRVECLRSIKYTPTDELERYINKKWETEFAAERQHYEESQRKAMKKIDDAIRKYLSRKALKVYEAQIQFPIVKKTDLVRKALELTRDTGQMLPISAANEKCKNLHDECISYLKSLNELDFEDSQVDRVFQPIIEFFGVTVIKASENNLRTFKADKSKTARSAEESCTYKISSESNFTKDYIVRYLAFIGLTASTHLQIIKDNFISKTDAYTYIKNRHKQHLEEMMLKRKEPEFMLARYINNEAEHAVLQGLGLIVCKALEEMDTKYMNKKAFMEKILTDLASKNDYIHFKEFFTDFNCFFKKQLELHIQASLENYSVRSKIISCVKEDIKCLIIKVEKDISSMENFHENVENWLSRVRDRINGKIAFCSEYALTYFLEMKEFESAESQRNFANKLKIKLDEFLESVNNSELSAIWNKAKMENYFVNRVYEKLSGCCEKCPFCSAPCLEQTKDHHPPHHSLHYPLGARGIVEASVDEVNLSSSKIQELHLVKDWCPLLIQSDGRFRSKYTIEKYNWFDHRWFNWNYIYYKDYQKEFPDWHIPRASEMKSDANDYWKRVLAQFGSHLAKEYNASCPTIPSVWKDIACDKAVESICTLLQN